MKLVALSAIGAVALAAAPICLLADVTVGNGRFTLTVGDDAAVKSLVVSATGDELVDPRDRTPLVTVTQERFFNNEIKLAYPSRETTCRANRVRRVGDELMVGFELVPYEARIAIRETPDYVGFELKGFDVELEDYMLGPQYLKWLDMKLPPVKRLRFLQLPVANRKWFGEWLNVSWDERSALAVVGTDPLTAIGNERRCNYRLMSADADVDLKLEGAKAALIVSAQQSFLDCLDRVEVDCGLPRGVADRRTDDFNACVYWTSGLAPDNVDRHLALMRKGGFRMMLVYHTAICDNPGDYIGVGPYGINDRWNRDPKQVSAMLGKLHEAGIRVGLHVLHPFVGFNSPYITPVADHRINLKRHFTLARAVGAAGGDELHVEEDPSACPTNEMSRVLRFGGELFTYSGFTSERPYKFTGVKRGAKKTNLITHPLGEIGGLVDVCEFGGGACYVDQRTSLQDELADKIAAVYNLGFDFFCMDGCEGVNAPFGIYVALAQYRVWKKLRPAPLFTEGAAKAHFAWHHLSGANAFDVFVPREFKQMIVRWPLHEAEMMRQDFSRVSFGWWGFWLPGEKLNDGTVSEGTQPDMWEFGTSRAAAWDSPTTIQVNLEKYARHPRLDDLMEIMRRWEYVRRTKWLTDEQKSALKSPTQEHHLYRNERGEYELCPMKMLPTPAKAPSVRGFVFTRAGRSTVAYWHTSGSGFVSVDLGGGLKTVPADAIRYLESGLSEEDVRRRWAAAVAVP